MDPSLLITWKRNAFARLGLLQCPQTWAEYNGSNNGPFTIQGKSNLQRKGFILDSLDFSGTILDSWQCTPWSGVLATCHKFYLYTNPMVENPQKRITDTTPRD